MAKQGFQPRALAGKGIAAAMLATVFVLAALLLAAAVLAGREALPLDYGLAYGMVAVFSASALGSVLMSRSLTERKGLAAILETVFLVLLLAALGLAVNGGGLGWKPLLLSSAASAAGAITGCIISAKGSGSKRPITKSNRRRKAKKRRL